MKIFLLLLLFFVLYFRRSIKNVLDNFKITYLISLYNLYKDADNTVEKRKYFQEIAKNRSMSNDLAGGYMFLFPSYEDFQDERKLYESYIRLIEKRDHNSYMSKKHLHPTYVIHDIFFLPALIFSFLLNHSFKKISSFFLSCLSWLLTFFISLYNSEIRLFIDQLIKKVTELQ